MYNIIYIISIIFKNETNSFIRLTTEITEMYDNMKLQSIEPLMLLKIKKKLV